MYLLTELGGWTGKIFGSRSGRTDVDRVQRGPCFLTESQIFFRPARPHSVNKHFIMSPLFFHFHFLVERRPCTAALLRIESCDFLSVASLWVGNCSISVSESSPG